MKILPQNIEAEKAVLGSIFLRPKSILEISSIISPESFYSTQHSKIFEIAQEMVRKDIPIDMLSVSKELEKQGVGVKSSYLVDLVSSVPSSTNIKNYAEMVAREKTLRDVIEMGNKITEVGFSNDYENIPVVLSKLQKDLILKNTKKSESIFETLNNLDNRTAEYKEKKAKGIDLLGLSCGYSKLDKVIDGLRPGHFWVIGAYSSLGKTTLALNMVADLVKQGKRAVFYSLEMSDVDVISKLIGIMTEENGKSIMKGYINNKERVEEARKRIVDSGLLIKTGVSDLSEIMFSMYEENIKSPVSVFVVDYIQLVKVKGAKSDYEIATTTSIDLQLNAQRLNIPIVALSQISNDSAKNNDSQLVAGFKGSGAINASADLSLEIKIREDSNEDRIRKIQNGEDVLMKIVIIKNRHGQVGYIDLTFSGHTGIFKQEYDINDM